MNLDHLTRLPLKVNLSREQSPEEGDIIESSVASESFKKSPTINKKVIRQCTTKSNSPTTLINLNNSFDEQSFKKSLMSQSLDISPYKHIDLSGPLQSHIASKFDLEKYDHLSVRESHNKFLNSERNVFGSPSKSLLRKTIQIGEDPSLRLCHRLEKSMSPTIVSMDKKGYELKNTPFAVHKRKYTVARDQLLASEQSYKVNTIKHAQERGHQDAQLYMTIPRALRNQSIE